MSPAISLDPSRVVRLERWEARAFHVVPCPFRVDLPLDMSGCIVAALQDAMRAGHRRTPGGAILASDRSAVPRDDTGAARALRNGAIYVQVDPTHDDPALQWLDGDLLARSLSPSGGGLRGEVDELLRWSNELGHDVESFFVGFAPGEGPRSFRAVRLLAHLADGPIVETFEVQSTRRYVTRAGAAF